MKRIAALVPYAVGAGVGQRLRIEAWSRHLEAAGWRVDFYPFEDEALSKVLHEPGAFATKAVRMLACYARRLRLVLGDVPCDVLFVYREAAVVGPSFIERLAFRRPVPVVYDLDDPIFVPYRGRANGWLSLLKFPGKTRSIIRRVDRVITVNRLLGDYAGRYNSSVTVIPMFVDTEVYRPPPARDPEPIRVGWTGSYTTMVNLQSIAEPLRRLQAETGSVLRVIGEGGVDIPGVDTEFREWSAATEVSDLADCDIGVVPLDDGPWNRWKFNFKTVQCMALGLPVVARRMGSNPEIIQDGVNGFLVETEDEWFERLAALARSPELRHRMGEAARRTVLEHYSVQTQIPRVIAIFEGLLDRSADGDVYRH